MATTPAVPYWAADWDDLAAATCITYRSDWATPPARRARSQIVQYGVSANGYDEDYAC